MSPDRLARRTIAFVNVAHALDHFVLLIYPTAIIAIAAEKGLPYATLIGLSTGSFVAFGLFSLPMGWLGDRLPRAVDRALACLLRALASRFGHVLGDLPSHRIGDAGHACAKARA